MIFKNPMFRQFVRKNEVLYHWWLVIRKERRGQRYVRQNTEITIEGFPRCANTYVYYSIVIAQSRKMEVAHHTHAIAEVKRSVRLNIPVIILFRKPIDCIASLLFRSTKITVLNAILDYEIFYEAALRMNKKMYYLDTSEGVCGLDALLHKINIDFNRNYIEKMPIQKEVYSKIRAINDQFEGGKRSKIAIPDESKRVGINKLKKTIQDSYGNSIDRLNSLYLKMQSQQKQQK